MQWAVTILLTAAIFACPILCAVGDCYDCDSGEAADGCSCCHEGGAANSGDGNSYPADSRPPDSGDACACICGGAVVDDAGSHVVHFDWSWSLPVAVVEPAVGQLHEALFRQFSLAPWPDVGRNAGRAICCLFSTYLC